MIKSMLTRELTGLERAEKWCKKRFKLRFLLYGVTLAAIVYYEGWLK